MGAIPVWILFSGFFNGKSQIFFYNNAIALG